MCGHAQVDIGIFGMGLALTPGADIQDHRRDHGGRLTAVLQMMTIALPGLEAGAIAGVERGFATVR